MFSDIESKNVKGRALCAVSKFVERYPEYKIAVASISGSHNFGWAGSSSDIDIRGAYIVPTMEFCNIDEPPMTIELSVDEYDVEFQMHEISKFTKLLIQPNLNMMDALFVKHQNLLVRDTVIYNRLCELGKLSLSKEAYSHVQGLVTHMEKHKKSTFGDDRITERYSPKKKLYVFRELMRGIVLFEKGVLINNIDELASELDEYESTVNKLVAMKLRNDFLGTEELKNIEDAQRELMSRMITAKEFGVLRARPQDNLRKLAKDFIYDVRKEHMDIGNR